MSCRSEYPFTHEKNCTSSDPINIIFRNVSLTDVEQEFSNMGWRNSRILASNQFIPYPNPMEKTRQNLQMHKGHLYKRCHIRLWNIESCIIAGVHVERISLRGHITTDFESIEKYVARIFRQREHWNIDDDALDLQNPLPGYKQPYNNGDGEFVFLLPHEAVFYTGLFLLSKMRISCFQIAALWPISMVIGACGIYIYRIGLEY
jgi:hypothetical protein